MSLIWGDIDWGQISFFIKNPDSDQPEKHTQGRKQTLCTQKPFPETKGPLALGTVPFPETYNAILGSIPYLNLYLSQIFPPAHSKTLTFAGSHKQKR